MEGKLQPEVFQEAWGSEGSAYIVRNGVFDEESNSSTRTRFRSVIPEEGVTMERYEGVRDVLMDESFCLTNQT